jgi:hypothetical protein
MSDKNFLDFAFGFDAFAMMYRIENKQRITV